LAGDVHLGAAIQLAVGIAPQARGCASSLLFGGVFAINKQQPLLPNIHTPYICPMSPIAGYFLIIIDALCIAGGVAVLPTVT
jgi:hypothetical protein